MSRTYIRTTEGVRTSKRRMLAPQSLTHRLVWCDFRTSTGGDLVPRARLKSWAEIGGRLAAARDLAGFTQRELGDKVGLHRSAITRIELGQRQLDALELTRLAEALGRSVDWFLTEPPAAIASRRDALSTDRDVLKLEAELEQLSRDVELLIDTSALTTTAAALPTGVTTLDEAEAGARQARQFLQIPEGPVIDLQATVERLGLLSFSLNLGPGVIDGGYVRVADTGVALINGAADAGRRRFNLAHELGHHLLADEYTADFGLGTARGEREALIDAFAVHFLMPRSSFRTRWTKLSDQCGDARRRLIVIAAEYRVSWTAAVSHARTLGLISRTDFESLKEHRPTRADYYELGIQFKEELDPIALSPAYSQAAVRAYRRGVISADRTTELLRNTVTADDLPRPLDTPVDALMTEFEDLP